MGTSVVPTTSLDQHTGVSSRDVVVDAATGLAARLYLPSSSTHHLHRNGKGGKRLPVLLYFHGGAFVVESAFGPAYHGYLNALAAKASVLAVSVNYRLTPEHPLPATYDDAWAALQWVLRNAGRPVARQARRRLPRLPHRRQHRRQHRAQPRHAHRRATTPPVPPLRPHHHQLFFKHHQGRGVAGPVLPGRQTGGPCGGAGVGVHLRGAVRDGPPVRKARGVDS
ncbi:hypothetical protein PR202_ga21255 [Eleusine coracana subsp. coracana]|uniref:Alpha/beta hydrolase fold-3 domain-containing protein n=1 Tax=Eleusine coracana subsp. coracana TaxID=191504 RepID=A0AAV5D0L8_ELECO|nr:hypothetical protein PR202_ga21255 [Eleusine coracana subsp. coracana]